MEQDIKKRIGDVVEMRWSCYSKIRFVAVFLGSRSSSSAKLPEFDFAELELGDPRVAEVCLFLGSRSSSSAKLPEFDWAELELGDPRVVEFDNFQIWVERFCKIGVQGGRIDIVAIRWSGVDDGFL